MPSRRVEKCLVACWSLLEADGTHSPTPRHRWAAYKHRRCPVKSKPCPLHAWSHVLSPMIFDLRHWNQTEHFPVERGLQYQWSRESGVLMTAYHRVACPLWRRTLQRGEQWALEASSREWTIYFPEKRIPRWFAHHHPQKHPKGTHSIWTHYGTNGTWNWWLRQARRCWICQCKLCRSCRTLRCDSGRGHKPHLSCDRAQLRLNPGMSCSVPFSVPCFHWMLTPWAWVSLLEEYGNCTRPSTRNQFDDLVVPKRMIRG